LTWKPERSPRTLKWRDVVAAAHLNPLFKPVVIFSGRPALVSFRGHFYVLFGDGDMAEVLDHRSLKKAWCDWFEEGCSM
jgi:hypothetical protein